MILLNTALVTVTHDPEGKNIKLFKEFKRSLEQVYSKLYIAISEETSVELIREFEKSTFNFKVIPKNGAANARREAVKFAIAGICDFYHYCDFDRILTWINCYPKELKKIVDDIPNYDYLILGRTERAKNTHPVEWIETERITNQIFSLEIEKEVDITAGSCAFSHRSAKFIDKYSTARMTDAEWAMIIWRIAKNQLDYCAVEGLEYREDINGLNLNVSESDRWFNRLKLSFIISETARDIGRGYKKRL